MKEPSTQHCVLSLVSRAVSGDQQRDKLAFSQGKMVRFLHLPRYPGEGHCFLRQLQHTVLNQREGSNVPNTLHSVWSDSESDHKSPLYMRVILQLFSKVKGTNRLTSPCSPKQNPCSSFHTHSSWDQREIPHCIFLTPLHKYSTVNWCYAIALCSAGEEDDSTTRSGWTH